MRERRYYSIHDCHTILYLQAVSSQAYMKKCATNDSPGPLSRAVFFFEQSCTMRHASQCVILVVGSRVRPRRWAEFNLKFLVILIGLSKKILYPWRMRIVILVIPRVRPAPERSLTWSSLSSSLDLSSKEIFTLDQWKSELIYPR